MNKLQKLKNELNVIELEDRLEMVNLAASLAEDAGNGVCCCSDTTTAK